MAAATCRSCGGTVEPGATTCRHCGIPDPISASTATAPGPGVEPAAPRGDLEGSVPRRETAGPPPERNTAGSRLKSAGKAIGCLVLALIVLGIAIVVGVFDLFF